MKKIWLKGALVCAATLIALCLGGCGSPNVEPADSAAPESIASQQADQQSDAAVAGEGESGSKGASSSGVDSVEDAGKKAGEDAAESVDSKSGDQSASAQGAKQAKVEKPKDAKDASAQSNGKSSSKESSASKGKDSGKNSATATKKPAVESGSAGQSSQPAKPESTEKPAPAPAPSGISVSISIDGCGYIPGVSKTLELEQGASVYDALKACGVKIGGNGGYVTSIEGLAEKAHGEKSGWVYRVNGKMPMVKCNAYRLAEGDRVAWSYVNAED